jgi:hypothetical protein
MIVKAWNSGAHNRNGNGYGFKVNPADRDAFFKKEWDTITLEIDGEEEPVTVTIDKEGFWAEESRELMSDALGKWLHRNGMAPWPRMNAPTFEIDVLEDNHFSVRKVRKGSKGPHSKPF